MAICTPEVALHVADRGRSAAGVLSLVSLFWDALLHMPASSVNVEKLHANTQMTATAHRSGRSEKSLQQHTYVMSARMEHARLKRHVEDETLGSNKKRAGKLLSMRVVARSLPGRSTKTRSQSSETSRSRGDGQLQTRGCCSERIKDSQDSLWVRFTVAGLGDRCGSSYW